MAELLGENLAKQFVANFDMAALRTRVQAGDAIAEEEIVSLLETGVRAFLSLRTGDRRLVEEVGQEVMMAVICALRDDRVREPAYLSSFACGVARNQLNDSIRKRSRERLESLTGNREFAALAADQDETRRFQTAKHEIERLFGTDREILSMTLIDGLKPAEIAVALSLSCDVVRQRKSRAAKKIADRLTGLS